MSLDEVEIDSIAYTVLDWEVFQAPTAPADLRITILGVVPYGAPPFHFNGELWYLTSGATSQTTTGFLKMTLHATNKTMPTAKSSVAPKSALPPKSRLRLPQLSTPVVADPHKFCVPLEHYNDLKAFIAMELMERHGGVLMVPDSDLSPWVEWRVLHSENGAQLHTFVAVHPDVVIEEAVDEDSIPF